MPEGTWKIHAKIGTIEIEVSGTSKDETFQLFEQVAKKMISGGASFPWK